MEEIFLSESQLTKFQWTERERNVDLQSITETPTQYSLHPYNFTFNGTLNLQLSHQFIIKYVILIAKY